MKKYRIKSKHSNKRFSVIYVYEREIISLGTTNTIEEAKTILKEDFEKVFNENCNENIFSTFCDAGITNLEGKWSFDETEAWINANNGNHDWKIIEN